MDVRQAEFPLWREENIVDGTKDFFFLYVVNLRLLGAEAVGKDNFKKMREPAVEKITFG